MSLQLWLPFNGNIQNQGLLNVSPASSSATFADGILGKCLVSPGVVTITSSAINYKKFSVAFWVKCKSGFTGDWKRILILNTKNITNGTSGNLRFEQAQTSFRSLSTHNNTSYDVDPGSTIFSTAVDTWMHVVYSYDGSNGSIKTYLNGQLHESRTSSKLGGQLNGYVEIASNYEGWICDFRLYDDIISPKEIKEISKGLTSHYKLGNGSGVNLSTLTNSKIIPSINVLNDYKATKTNHEDHVSIECTTAGTGFYFSPFSKSDDKVGKTYTWSFYGKCNVTKTGSVGHEAGGQKSITLTTEWQLFTHTWTFSTSSYSAFTFYMNWNVGEILYIKDFKFEEGSKATPWCPSSAESLYTEMGMNSNIEFDCSGFERDGTKVGDITPVSNSPRYNSCYKFGADSHIKIPRPFIASITSKFTVSMWVKPKSGCGGYSIIMSNYNSPGANGFWLAINTEGSGIWFYNGNYLKAGSTLALDTWHHIVLTFNAGTVSSYVNGVKTGTANVSASDKAIAFTDYLGIGNSYTGTQWNTDFVGEISDVRIYGTVLSDADILALYNTPISSTKNGTLFAYEFEEV